MAAVVERVRKQRVLDEVYGGHSPFYVEHDRPDAVRTVRPCQSTVHPRTFLRDGPPVRLGCRVHGCIDADGAHVHRRLEQVVVALGVCLGLYPVVAPHIHAMAAHEDRLRHGVLGHGLAQAVGELALARGVLNDGDHERVVVAVAGDALDHFQVRASELRRRGVEQGGKHALGRVRVEDRSRVAQLVCSHEEWRALAQLGRLLRGPSGLRCVRDVAGRRQDEHVAGLHALLLDAGGSHHDAAVLGLDGDAAAGAAHPALGVERAA
mmetsp:Transcript_10380/g.38272  ORF Transcript_10380/g.38272 Transcript_10380/m.38272 type:complete len:265 (+) Transcript_10380:1806-2600(+)